jgi:hypothetical protein
MSRKGLQGYLPRPRLGDLSHEALQDGNQLGGGRDGPRADDLARTPSGLLDITLFRESQERKSLRHIYNKLPTFCEHTYITKNRFETIEG